MRTTVDLPDELLKQARARAANEGTTLTALLADGLRMRIRRMPGAAEELAELPLSHSTGGLHPWIDPASNESMLDAADDDAHT